MSVSDVKRTYSHIDLKCDLWSWPRDQICLKTKFYRLVFDIEQKHFSENLTLNVTFGQGREVKFALKSIFMV